MRKSRNQLRLERRWAEYERPGTVQYQQAHRVPRVRQWMRETLKPEVLAKVLTALGLGQRVSVKRGIGGAR